MSSCCCCNEPPKLSDSPVVIAFVYLFAFLPLGAVYAFDFISVKWRSIRRTQVIGTLQVILTAIGLGTLIFYIVQNIIDEDYKEAAAAVAVGVVHIHNLFKIIWGIMQLFKFRRWNVQALVALLQLGYSVPKFRRSYADKTDIGLLRRWKKYLFLDRFDMKSFPKTVSEGFNRFDLYRTVSAQMLVNSSLIDNRFRDHPFRFRPALRWPLKITDTAGVPYISLHSPFCFKSNKEPECATRWVSRFLSSFGREWVADTKAIGAENQAIPNTLEHSKRTVAHNLAVVSCMHTTKMFESLVSPLHRFCYDPASSRNTSIELNELHTLPFSEKLLSEHGFMDFGNQEVVLRDAVEEDWDQNDPWKANAVHVACFSSLMAEMSELRVGPDPTKELRSENEGISWTMKDPRVETWMYQLGYDGSEHLEDVLEQIPINKDCLKDLLWENEPNRLLLQTSVHVDNYLAIESGDRLASFLENKPIHHTQPELTFQKSLEISRIKTEVGNLDNTYLNSPESGRFAGCVVETVRSTLAKWARKNESLAAESQGWKVRPENSSKSFTIVCPAQLKESFRIIERISEKKNSQREFRSVYMRLLWVIQGHLQEKIALITGDPRKSKELVMLFILGFPSLKFTKREGEVKNNQSGPTWSQTDSGSVVFSTPSFYSIEPVEAPQKVTIYVRPSGKYDKFAVKLETVERSFDWQRWKEAFSGRLSAQKEWRLTRLLSKDENLLEESSAPNTGEPITTLMDTIVGQQIGRDYNVVFWKGWPPHLPQIAQFENEKLYSYLRARHPLIPPFNDLGSSRLRKNIQMLTQALKTKYTFFGDVVSLEEAQALLDDGRESEALKMFGRCIEETGSREAMEAAISIVTDKELANLQEEQDLISQMSKWMVQLMKSKHNESTRGDIEFMANSFGRLHEKSQSANALKPQVQALFHKQPLGEPVSLVAIQIAERYMESARDTLFASQLNLYLAVAHLSRYDEYHHARDRGMAGANLRALAMDPRHRDEPFVIHIAYLIEKGHFSACDQPRIDTIFEFFNDLEDEKRLKQMFERLFLRSQATPAVGIFSKVAVAAEIYDSVATRTFNLSIKEHCLNRLGILHHIGSAELPPNKGEAVKWYMKALDIMSAPASCNMQVLWYSESGLSQDLSAVVPKSSIEMNNLATMWQVQKRHKEAEYWYKQAIERKFEDGKKNVIAMYNLFVLFAIQQNTTTRSSFQDVMENAIDLPDNSFVLKQIRSVETRLNEENGSLLKDNKVIQVGGIQLEEYREHVAHVQTVRFVQRKSERVRSLVLGIIETI